MTTRILLVDDSLFGRKTAKKALASGDYELLEAKNGQEALEQIRTHQPDLVITDLLMPIMDGFEFLKELRGGGSRLPVIVASADIQDTTRENCGQLGICGFLNKPFTASQLRELVEQAIEQPVEVLQ